MFKCVYVGGDGTNGQMGPDASYDQVQLSSQSGDVTIYTAVPSTPGKGGNGGKGGIGGLGGNSGGYVLMSFKNKDKKKSSILEKSMDGPNYFFYSSNLFHSCFAISSSDARYTR